MSERTNTEIIRAFGAALRQARELRVEKLRFALDQLEFFHSEMAEAYTDLRAVMGAYNEVMAANAAHVDTVSEELKNLPCWDANIRAPPMFSPY